MLKHRIFSAILCGLILTSLAGCANNPQSAMTDDGAVLQVESADGSLGDNTNDDITADSPELTDTESEESESAEEPIMTEKESSAQDVDSGRVASSETPAPTQAPPTQSEKPASTDTSKSATTATPQQSETPKPPEPEAPAETPKPAEPEPTTPSFNIDDWISYAKNYAAGVGLELESSAVDCWDNPIVAGAHSTNLERDIQSRLNRYTKDEDITDVWIWAQPRGDGSYDLYIGYA